MILAMVLGTVLCGVGNASEPSPVLPGGPTREHPADPPDPAPGMFQDLRGLLCPDIAFTDLFRKKDLSYVHTPEFADAVSAVADGTSSYSPSEIPAHWPAAASAWRLHLLAHEWARRRGEANASPAGSIAAVPSYDLRLPWENFREAAESCSPFLLYLASREYRSRPGHEAAKIVFPYLVPAAIEDLGEMIRPFAFRAAEIASRLGKARELDAEKCAPGKLSPAIAALEEARDRVWTSHYDAGRVDPLFARSAVAADDLLAERRYAMRHGFICYSR